MDRAHLLRVGFGGALLTSLPACAGGVNAGEKGGVAFITFAIMLLVTLGILWVVLGRER